MIYKLLADYNIPSLKEKQLNIITLKYSCCFKEKFKEKKIFTHYEYHFSFHIVLCFYLLSFKIIIVSLNREQILDCHH